MSTPLSACAPQSQTGSLVATRARVETTVEPQSDPVALNDETDVGTPIALPRIRIGMQIMATHADLLGSCVRVEILIQEHTQRRTIRRTLEVRHLLIGLSTCEIDGVCQRHGYRRWGWTCISGS